MQALREMIAPRAEMDRDALRSGRGRRSRKPQAYKHELGLIYAAVERTRDEMTVFGAEAAERRARPRAPAASLPRSSGGTERATQSILQAAEEIDQAAHTLSASLKSAHDQGARP